MGKGKVRRRVGASEATNGEHVAHVGGEAERIEHGQQIEQALVVGVVRPAFDGNAVGCVRAEGVSV